MPDHFIEGLLAEHSEVQGIDWITDNIVSIERRNQPPFKAAILKLPLVGPEDVEPYLTTDLSVIVNFPKIGKWTGSAIAACEEAGKAWGQWSLLLRAINAENPEATVNPQIAFSRRALRQHDRVLEVTFELDHLLLVRHENGTTLRVALVYEYDLTGNDVRTARDNLGQFDVLLKTNPNGSILAEAHDAATALCAKVFQIAELLRYLARGRF